MTEKPSYERLEQRIRELERAEVERKKAVAALRQSEEKYRGLVDNSPTGIVSIDINGNVLSINKKALEIYGSPSEEATKKAINAFEYEPLIRAGVTDAIKQCIEENRTTSTENYYTSKWSKKAYLYYRINPVHDAGGRVIGAMANLLDLTERKQAGEALKEREHFIRQLIDAAPNLFYIYDVTEHRNVYANDGIERILGYSPEELRRYGETLFPRIIHPDDLEKVAQHHQRLNRTADGETLEIEYRAKHAQGNWVTLHSWDTVFMWTPEGEVKQIAGAAFDITAQKRAEAALKENEKKFRHFFETAMVGMYRTRMEDGQFLAANQTLAEMLGYASVDDLITGYITSEHYTEPKLREALLDQLRSEGRVEGFEIEMERAGGSPIQIALSATVYPEHGYLEGVIIDISDRVRAEAALRESEERYRALVENNPDLIYRTDLQGRITYMSSSVYRLSGYTAEESIGMKMAEEVYAVPEEGKILLKKLSEQGFVRNFQARLKRKDGSLWWASTNAHFLKDKDGNIQGVEGATRDVSEIRAAEEEKKHLSHQLQQSQKFEAIGTLAGGLAHDFNNLLMGIQGRISLISMDLASDNPLFEHIAAVEEYIRSATDLTRQLLGFARGGKYEVQAHDINALVLQSSSMFGRTRKEIQVRTRLKTPAPVAEVDGRQIEQVLLNMYVNAWQAMPDGGELYLETRIVTVGEAYGEAHQVEPGSYVRVSVTDTGIGMDEATRQRVFDPFFTTKEKTRGTGLGLASALGIIKNHGGMITVYSESGRGTTFNIYLPVSHRAFPKDSPKKERISRGSETVLLVDDEEMITEVGQRMLEKLGYRVIVAGDGGEAVETVKRMGGEIDLVLLDLIMPGMDGGKTFDRIREMQPGMRVLLSSGYSINGQADKIMRRGCNGFIQKPFNIAELSEKVRATLDKP